MKASRHILPMKSLPKGVFMAGVACVTSPLPSFSTRPGWRYVELRRVHLIHSGPHVHFARESAIMGPTRVFSKSLALPIRGRSWGSR